MFKRRKKPPSRMTPLEDETFLTWYLGVPVYHTSNPEVYAVPILVESDWNQATSSAPSPTSSPTSAPAGGPAGSSPTGTDAAAWSACSCAICTAGKADPLVVFGCDPVQLTTPAERAHLGRAVDLLIRAIPDDHHASLRYLLARAKHLDPKTFDGVPLLTLPYEQREFVVMLWNDNLEAPEDAAEWIERALELTL